MKKHSTPSSNADARFLLGGGEMGERMRAMDWSKTPLGPIEQWPQSLRTTISILLASGYPMYIAWARDFTQIYNDAYRPILGSTKHPAALGQSTPECFSEIWDFIGPMFERVLEVGEATTLTDQLLELDRHGYVEECYFTFSYSAIRDETGRPGGVLVTVIETTARVLSERRMQTLRELAEQAAQTKSAEEICKVTAKILEKNPHDLPFALLYLLDEDGKRARLIATTRMESDATASPAVIPLTGELSSWPLSEVMKSGSTIVEDLAEKFGTLPGGAWSEPAKQAIALPLAKAGQEALAGFLVAGISSRLPFNDDYRGFMGLMAGHIATAIANARAYEEERKRAESLAELDRAKTTFFSNVSHEFRTPLTLMLGPVENLLNEAGLSPAQHEQVEVLHRNGLRLLKLVNTLLDFSRIEAGRAQAVYEPVDLAVYTIELASMFRSAVEKASMQLVIDCPPLPEPVFVDRDMWEKLVLNLISNAFKFTQEGEIRVSLRAEDGKAVLSVQDTGIGIPESELPNLFNRFHRVEGARGRTHEGTGIGLALVQELAKLHGGMVAVESVYGKGSDFTVIIPLGKNHLPADRIGSARTLASTALGANSFVEEALRWFPDEGAENGKPFPVSESPSPADNGSRAKVVLADDNADMRDYVRRLLGSDYEVIAVGDGQEALRATAQYNPDLVLTDMMMPNMDGFGLLKALREDPHTASIPVIMLSARAGEDARVEGLQSGADDYLIKPFSARELLARVKGMIALSKFRSEASQREEELKAETTNVLESISEAFASLDRNFRYTYINAETERIYGLRREDVIGKNIWELFPDALGTIAETEYYKAMTGRVAVKFEIFYIPWKRWLEVNVYPANDGGLATYFRDITDSKRSKAIIEGQKQALELAVHGAPLSTILEVFIQTVETQSADNVLASMLLLDEDGIHLRHGAAPSLPDSYNQAIDGVAIGPSVGSCGTAAYTRQTVVVNNIANDPLWEDFRTLALDHGLHACWSTPILSSQGKVLGTFALYYKEVNHPTPQDQEVVYLLKHTAAVVIERDMEMRDRRAAEQALRKSEEQFRLLFKNSGDAILITDDDGNYLEANQAACELLGYSHEQLLRMKVSDLIATDSPNSSDRYRTYVEKGSETDEFSFVRPDGEHRIAQYKASRFAPGRHLSTLRDITEQKDIEVALQKQSRRLRLMWEAASLLLTTDEPDKMMQELFNKIAPHFGLDTYFNFMVNDAGDALRLESCTGIPEETARTITRLEFGQAVCGTVALRREPIVVSYIQDSDLPMTQLVKSFGIRTYACSPLIVDGKLLGTLSFASHTRDQFDEDEVEFLRTICHYVTVAYERLRLVLELKENDRRKDEFLATLAHELRNPLAPIRNGLQIMRIAGDNRDVVEQAREMMERQLQQMVHLIDDLLDLSRISRGKIELRKERVDLAAVLQNAVETSRPLIEQSGHRLTISTPSESIFVDADVTRLAQVFANLLNNAAKYTEKGGRIWLTVERQANYVVVSVKDTGVGIPSHLLPRVFEMFSQVDRSLEKSQGGLGIGLSIVKRLVEMHGGTVEARSEGHGSGSEFIVHLPALVFIAQESQPLGEDEEQAKASARRRIVVADDNEDSAFTMAMMLKIMGNEVRTAADGVEAVELAEAFRPEVILLDIGMPKLNGYDACRRIREQSWGSRIVMVALTGWGQDEDKRRSEEAGFDYHLVKPVEPEMLEKVLASLQTEEDINHS